MMQSDTAERARDGLRASIEWCREHTPSGVSLAAAGFALLIVLSGAGPFAAFGGVISPDHTGVAAADVENSSYVNTYNVSSEDTVPEGVTFNSDGSKMYVAGYGNGNIYEYDLSTPWDTTTATHSQTLDISGQDGSPRGVEFGADGSKMYVAGYSNVNLYEYDLSTAYDISSASHTSTHDVSSEDITPVALGLNDDGTKIILGGGDTDTMYQYDMSTAYDLSTASYSGTSFSVSGETTDYTGGIEFNGDGSKMVIIGDGYENIHEYNLTSEFDVSTATYTGDSFNITSEDSMPRGLELGKSGEKMYTTGNEFDNVYEYDASISGYPDPDSGSSSSSGTDQTVGLVEDELGMFPPEDSTLVVEKRTTEYRPLYEAYSSENWRKETWEESQTTTFNWENKTSISLEDGRHYRFELDSPYGTWEESGFEYDAAEMSGSTIWLRPETGHLDGDDDGNADGTGDSGPNDGGSTDDGDSTPTETEETGFGPTALGYCTTLDGEDGVEVEYWDPDYTTHVLDGNLSADGSAVYNIYKEFDDPRGYYRGCVADSMTENASDDRDTGFDYNATDGDGNLVAGGSSTFSAPTFAPTGDAPSSTGERVGLLAGVLGALGALWFGGQRFLPASSVSAWPVESINPAFGIGGPIVALLGLDMAGGGVISAGVATGLAQIAPFAGVVGVTIGGYYALRWIRAPPA